MIEKLPDHAVYIIFFCGGAISVYVFATVLDKKSQNFLSGPDEFYKPRN